MHVTERHRAPVPPVPPSVERPRWSVMIPTYNCAGYLREALAGVLAQAPGPDVMQIEVVDDCSTADDPAAVVAELGGGRVAFHRQPRNVGHSRNFTTCIQRARGELVHLLHGDDWVAPSFHARMARLFADHPEIGAAFCRHTIADEAGAPQRLSPLEREDAGVLDGWLERIAAELRVQPPAMVVRREVYERLGGFDDRMRSCGEDWEMWVRIAARYPVGYEPEPLAFYRDNPGSLTKRSIRDGQNIRDVRLATRIARAHLPPGPARDANRQAMVRWARWALHWAFLFIERGDYRPALVQLREALRCSRDPEIVRTAARLGRQAAGEALAARVARAARAARV
jgi:glycosyltransferase involved in cell wall biosynthesis